MMDESILVRLMEPKWHEVLSSIFIAPDKDSELFNAIIARYRAKDRRYHDVTHISACVTLAQLVAKDHPYFEEIFLALMFHDVIQDSRNPEQNDEEESAVFAARELKKLRIGVTPKDRILKAIRSTRTHTGFRVDSVSSWVCDIDMSILGECQEAFDLYERGIRAEYCWVETERYQQERAKFLRGLLDKGPIYHNPFMKLWLEERARSNIEGLIERFENGDTGQRVYQAYGESVRDGE